VNPEPPSSAIPGRGPNLNPANRFESIRVVPDGEWLDAEFAETGSVPHPRTQFYHDATESILVHNDSPDVGPGWGLNCYRGCEHGCAYCFARPYHDYLGWSSGLDFETKILVKTRAPELLRAELSARKWRPETIMMSGVTDCYQPAERYFPHHAIVFGLRVFDGIHFSALCDFQHRDPDNKFRRCVVDQHMVSPEFSDHIFYISLAIFLFSVSP